MPSSLIRRSSRILGVLGLAGVCFGLAYTGGALALEAVITQPIRADLASHLRVDYGGDGHAGMVAPLSAGAISDAVRDGWAIDGAPQSAPDERAAAIPGAIPVAETPPSTTNDERGNPAPFETSTPFPTETAPGGTTPKPPASAEPTAHPGDLRPPLPPVAPRTRPTQQPRLRQR